MNINELKSFLAVIEASKNAYSQPAMTMRIQKLESELGVQLFKTSGL